jgi:hypothetical protein
LSVTFNQSGIITRAFRFRKQIYPGLSGLGKSLWVQVAVIDNSHRHCYPHFKVRQLSIEYPGAVYHITARVNAKKPVLPDDQERENFLNTLRHVNKRDHWLCHAYCLMRNHCRLSTTSRIMRERQ